GARGRERQGRVVGGRVRDRAAVQRERGRGAVVEVGGGVAGLHGVVEGQRRGARAGGVVGGSRGGRGVEGQLRRAGDGDVLAEVDRDRDHRTGRVGAVGRARADRADRRRGRVDDDVLRVAEAVRGARSRQRQRRVVGGCVRDRAAVQRERRG